MPAMSPAEKAALAKLSGGRVSVALLELKRRLETELPAQIDFENARQKRVGNAKLGKPVGYGIAPTGRLADAHVGHLLVGASSVQKLDAGTRAFRNQIALQIHVIGAPIESDEQTLNRHDFAEIVAITLQPYLIGCVDPQGRVPWRELVFQGVGPLPGDWKQFSGQTISYLLNQSPADDLWAPTS